jgi:hypothetical protein
VRRRGTPTTPGPVEHFERTCLKFRPTRLSYQPTRHQPGGPSDVEARADMEDAIAYLRGDDLPGDPYGEYCVTIRK